EFVDVKITEALPNSLRGELINLSRNLLKPESVTKSRIQFEKSA
ncbi:MAG TPA: TRAM domain-containing protein, partial [Thiotrichales bacterium]|nr:TRAM domain-containing protein [Thiotrichales bacterium]